MAVIGIGRILRSYFERMSRNRNGNVGILFALGAPVLLGGVFVAVELSQITAGQAKLQAIADSAALAAARELRLGNATKDTVLHVARAFVDAQVPAIGASIVFEGDVPAEKKWVKVVLTSAVRQTLANSLGLAPSKFVAHARARVMGGSPVCAIGLRENQDASIWLTTDAVMDARNCSVYSNSRTAGSIVAQDNSLIKARVICAAGGRGGGIMNFSPQPTPDCPPIPDPLIGRPAPQIGNCDAAKTDLKIINDTITLSPGTYCGGIMIMRRSRVNLLPGVYVMKEGPLVVDGDSTLTGKGVGFYFTGSGAFMDLRMKSTVSLEAPKEGPMAGLLFFQDRRMTDLLRYEISSDNAPVLLGTIYLPAGRFYAAGSRPFAQQSAYTIIIAQQINLAAGPTMVLNSNYSLTDVPVPDGVGPLANKVQLER